MAEREWQQYAEDTKDIPLLEAFKEKHKADPVYVRLAEARIEELKRGDGQKAEVGHQATPGQQREEVGIREILARSQTAHLGLWVADKNDAIVVRSVDDASEAAQRGIKSGDVVLEVNGLAMKSRWDLYGAVTRRERPL
jgi:S1-C subfamily serine protease